MDHQASANDVPLPVSCLRMLPGAVLPISVVSSDDEEATLTPMSLSSSFEHAVMGADSNMQSTNEGNAVSETQPQTMDDVMQRLRNIGDRYDPQVQTEVDSMQTTVGTEIETQRLEGMLGRYV